MPTSYQKARPHPRYKPYRLKDAAKNGQIIQINCMLCNRTVNFLASDLAKVYGPDHPASDSPFSCTTCETDEYLRVKARSPQAGDYGHMIVRRPGEIKKTQMWENVRLGDEPMHNR